MLQNNPAGIIKVDGSGKYETYATQEEGLVAMYELIEIYIEHHKLNSISRIRDRWSETEDANLIVEIWSRIILQR